MNDLSRKIKSGAVWSVFNRLSVQGLQFLAMLILARTLSPEDFAIMGIISFFIVISQSIMESGMAGFLLKKKEINEVDYSTLFIFNLTVSLLLYVCCFLLSDKITVYYNVDRLGVYINVAMLAVIISAFGQIQNVILLRNYRFKEISIISIISSFLGLLSAIILAVKECGVWALIFQNIIFQSSIVFFQLCYNRYFPRLTFSLNSFREQWKFGIGLLASHLLTNIYQNIFAMIFPKISSLHFAGLYTQANKIQLLPINLISSVLHSAAFPVLAQIHDSNIFKDLNRRLLKKIYVVSFVILSYVMLFSKRIIYIVLGKQWIDSYYILSILCVSGIFVIVLMVIRNTFKSLALTNYIFYTEIFRIITAFVCLFICLYWGYYAILLGIVCASFISMLFAMKLLSTKTNYTFKEQIYDILLSILPAFLTIVLFLCLYYLFDIGVYDNFLIMSCVFLLSILGWDFILNRELICFFSIFLRR